MIAASVQSATFADFVFRTSCFPDTDLRKSEMLHWLSYEKRKKREKTPSEIKKKKALLAARAAARAKQFTDLAPPSASASAATPSPEPSVSGQVDPDANPFEGPPTEEGKEYQPVEQHAVSVKSRVIEPSSASASAPAEPLTSAASIALDDLNMTTTAPSELQVQFLLLEPSAEVDPNDSYARHTYARQCIGLKGITSDCNANNVDAALVMLESDELNFDLCTVLQHTLHLHRVIAEIQNPNWTSMFAAAGVLTVFPYSLASHTLAELVLTSEHHPLELVPPNRPLHVSLSKVIQPDTVVVDPPLYLRHLAPEDQKAFLQEHPDPPMPREQMWKFDEKIHVVSAAARDEYLSQIQSLHGNNSIQLDHSGAAAAAEMTFSGPGMLNLTSGHDVDPDDPEEKKFQEARRKQSVIDRQAAYQRKRSIAEGADEEMM
jgi:hypothetical protein